MTDQIREKKRLDPRKTLAHQIGAVARLIESEVAYFNGWYVTEKKMREDCKLAAANIMRYLRRNGLGR